MKAYRDMALFVLIFAAFLALALTVGHAKDRGKQEDRARTVESVTDQIERLQDRLQQDLSAERRDRIEGQLDRIVEKYGITLPPPVDPPAPPEPKELFKDIFDRNTTALGNGWLGHDGSIEGEHMRLTPNAEAYKAVDLQGQGYSTITVSFDMVPEVNGSGDIVGQDAHMFWTEGDPANTLNRHEAVTTEMSEFPDHTHYEWTTPEKLNEAGEPEPYTVFGFGFATDAQSAAAIDNVAVNGEPFPASSFVGF